MRPVRVEDYSVFLNAALPKQVFMRQGITCEEKLISVQTFHKILRSQLTSLSTCIGKIWKLKYPTFKLTVCFDEAPHIQK